MEDDRRISTPLSEILLVPTHAGSTRMCVSHKPKDRSRQREQEQHVRKYENYIKLKTN